MDTSSPAGDQIQLYDTCPNAGNLQCPAAKECLPWQHSPGVVVHARTKPGRSYGDACNVSQTPCLGAARLQTVAMEVNYISSGSCLAWTQLDRFNNYHGGVCSGTCPDAISKLRVESHVVREQSVKLEPGRRVA